MKYIWRGKSVYRKTDEIFVWAKKGRKNKVYRLKTDASVKQLFVELFNNGVNALMQDESGDEREPIPFENNYTVTAFEENFIIGSFVIPQELQDAIDAPDVVENYRPIDDKGKTEDGFEIRAIVIGAKDEKGYRSEYMIIRKKDCDRSGAFYICTQKFRYNNEICQRIFEYIQHGGAILRPVNFNLPTNKIFEEFSLADCCAWTTMNRAISDVARELKNRQVWRAEVAFGKYSEDIEINKLGWLVQYNSELMSETEFCDLITDIAHNYNCEYAITNMSVINGVNEEFISDIVGVRCHWGMGNHQIAHYSCENILSNYYD